MRCGKDGKRPDPVVRGFTRIKLVCDIKRFDDKGERLVLSGTSGIITAKDLGPGRYLAAFPNNILLELTADDFVITSYDRVKRR